MHPSPRWSSRRPCCPDLQAPSGKRNHCNNTLDEGGSAYVWICTTFRLGGNSKDGLRYLWGACRDLKETLNLLQEKFPHFLQRRFLDQDVCTRIDRIRGFHFIRLSDKVIRVTPITTSSSVGSAVNANLMAIE